MLENFWFNVEYGINHVLNINAYDHVLFLIVFTIPYFLRIGNGFFYWCLHLQLAIPLSLVLAAYNIVSVNGQLIEFLIPVTILIVAVFNVFTAGKGPQKGKVGVLFFSTLFFGLIHGLGFAREFQMLAGKTDSKLALLGGICPWY